MDAASSAQNNDDTFTSWHPAMRPNSQRLDEVYGKPTDQNPLAPLHSVDNEDEKTKEEPIDGLSYDGQPQHNTSLSVTEDHQHITSAEGTVQSDIQVSRDVDDLAGNVEGSESIEKHGAGTGAALSESYSRSGSSRKSYTHDLLEEGESAQPDWAAPTGHATNPFQVRNALGGEEEMAKAWSSEPSFAGDPEPGDVSRTNSFPRVPPLQETETTPQPLSHSQAEHIMEEDKSDESIDCLPSLGSFDHASSKLAAQQQLFEPAEDENEISFANSNAKQEAEPVSQADEESRFEEGLPLMHAPEHFATNSQAHGPDARKSSNTEGNDDGFFDGTSQPSSDEEASFRPQALDRKSTTQVLEALHYAPHSATHGGNQSAEEKQLSEVVTSGEIEASPNTAISQDDAQINNTEPQPKDEDLAEMWKAALDDDDLLEDNEGLLDPSSFFENDGEGFFEDGEDQVEPLSQATTSLPTLEPFHGSDGSMERYGQTSSSQHSSRDKYLPETTSQPLKVSSKYNYGHSKGAAAHQPLPSNLNHSVSALGGFMDADGQYSHATQSSSSRPQMPLSTQSFADKSKGGYTSPYDLPMDVTRPKKRTPHQQLRPNSDAQVAPARPPPPRSSSMFTGAVPTLDAKPPVPRLPSGVLTSKALAPSLKASPSMGNFFEELPLGKARPPSSMGRAAYPTSQSTPPPPMSFQHDPLQQASTTQQRSLGTTTVQQQYQLLPPERISLYASASQPEPGKQTLPIVNARYSPAPAQQPNVPPPRTRYAASPSTVGRPVPSQTLSFQPRTSSPLAQNGSLVLGNHQPSVSDPLLHRPASSERQVASAQNPASLSSKNSHQNANVMQSNIEQAESTRKSENNLQFENSPSVHLATHASSPSDLSYAMNKLDADQIPSDISLSFQQPRESLVNPAGASARSLPARRSQSQSPDAGRYKPELPQSTQNQYQRPMSVNNHVSLPSAETRPPLNQMRQHERTPFKELNYIKPFDGREMDLLERWKGSPIFNFGFGGTIVTSFPKQIPRYAVGQGTPMIKCSPGEVKIQDGKILPLAEDIATFPGPLRSKSKKKDVLDWLQRRIAQLESSEVGKFSSATLPDPRKRHDEKILLWKIVRVLVEYDGAIDGNTFAENVIKSMLSPELTVGDAASIPPQTLNSPLLGISRGGGSRSIRDLVKPEAVEDLRKILLHGEREKAVWHAVDNHLWAHAMLLASTLEKNVWRQVSQEFVRQEVKTFGDNTESLAALYQIFAGNWEESMDELVPPSARAGLQLVSKIATTGPTKNALDGLDRWRETLTLILSNRTVDDGRALISLGQLLAGYGRIEAAHICYIFAKSPGLFGGPDDSPVSVALLGADHLQQPFDYGRDLDCILLTEIYDFVHTVLASSSAATISPHLQSYKLYHAMILVEYGHKSEAQQYCEMIMAALNSTTKRSPYYHNLLFGALEDLVDRLRQAPRDNSGSWISKPSIDKVSGSIWAKFNQYVAGDDNDNASTASGKILEQDTGPFARVAGESPSLSRTPSSSDMYGAYASGIGASQAAPTSNISNSRYAPAGLYTPRSSLEQLGNSSQDPQQQTQVRKESFRPTYTPQQHQSRPMSSSGTYSESYKPKTQPPSYPPHTESYLPTPPSQPEYMPASPPEDPSSSLYQQESYRPTPPLELEPSRERYEGQLQSGSARDDQPSSKAYEPQSYTYEPPSMNAYQPQLTNSYDPPTYDPYVPPAGESPAEENPKKKSFMDNDDDDDFEARAAALRKEEKLRKDREADEAFRRAAEADGTYHHVFSPKSSN